MEVGFLFVNNLLYYLKIKGITMLTFKEFVAVREQLNEMANLNSSRTGVEMRDLRIYVSPQQGSHGCRIKAFRNSFEGSEEFIVTVPECKVVTDTKTIPKHIKKQIIQYAIKNSYELVLFWRQKKYYGKVEFDELVKKMKLKPKDILAAEQIDLKDRKK